jgi:hypothetical protein
MSQALTRELAVRLLQHIPFLKPCGGMIVSLSDYRVQPVTTATTGFTTTQLNERTIILPISMFDQIKTPAPICWGG